MEISRQWIWCPIQIWIMEIRSPLENDFTLARYRPHEKFLARAFGLSEGLQGVSKETQNKGLSSISKTFLLIR
jgi:hypothetical protein